MTDLLGTDLTRPRSDELTIDALIDRRLVRAVYQPLVHLATRETVGYEALARGPVGTPFENPMTMLDAARAAGRLPELDWACRAAAVRGALIGGLRPPFTLFINAEPDTIGTPCPDELAPLLATAESELRVVTEFTERALARDPSGLLSAVNEARHVGWGVALDDVGAEPASLALLPFLHPDVIKLDLRLVQARTDGEIAAIANAVRAHAERTGAVVLAEGIETEEQAQTAVVLGATYGQGWLFGRPGPLPVLSVVPADPFPLLPAEPDHGRATPFEVVAAARSTQRIAKRLLIPMSHHLEDQAQVGGEPAVVLGCFQHVRYYTEGTRARFEKLAGATALAAVLGRGLDLGPDSAVRSANLSPFDPLADEWNVIVVGPFFAAALVARDLGDEGPDNERRFDFVITHDRALVLAAARAALQRITVHESAAT
ncbi:MAG: hypothetical protein QOK14_1012 [Frankiaceae bacterium]|nr:hypothetical protein [Frankiaceae bacterium]